MRRRRSPTSPAARTRGPAVSARARPPPPAPPTPAPPRARTRRWGAAGADIIRVSCPDVASTTALRQIVREARVPIVADIHFHYKRALEAGEGRRAGRRANTGA